MIPKTEVHSGSSFEDFLEEEGIREEIESAAIARDYLANHKSARPKCTFSAIPASIN